MSMCAVCQARIEIIHIMIIIYLMMVVKKILQVKSI